MDREVSSLSPKASCCSGESTSNDDEEETLVKMVLGEISKQQERKMSADNLVGRSFSTGGPAPYLSGDQSEARGRRRRFERGRPIRRLSSKPRNYTTSIFVTPPMIRCDERKRSSDDIDLLRIRNRDERSQRNGYGGGETLVPLPVTLRVVLNDSSRQNLKSGAAEDGGASLEKANEQPVQVLLSGKPEDLSYV